MSNQKEEKEDKRKKGKKREKGRSQSYGRPKPFWNVQFKMLNNGKVGNFRREKKRKEKTDLMMSLENLLKREM